MIEPSKEEIEKGFKDAILLEMKKTEDPLKFLIEMKEKVEAALRKMAESDLAFGDAQGQDYKIQLRVIKLLILAQR